MFNHYIPTISMFLVLKYNVYGCTVTVIVIFVIIIVFVVILADSVIGPSCCVQYVTN
jgi:hypothetical protein